jgi:hypothetical protein
LSNKMKPEAVVLQKPMDPGQATLANGVKCGDTFRLMIRPNAGWPEYIDFTGRLFSTFPPGGDDDEVTRIPTNDFTHYTGNAGKRILGLAVNRLYPDQSMLLIDNGADEDNPGAQECEIVVGMVRNTLHPELQDILRSWRLMP